MRWLWQHFKQILQYLLIGFIGLQLWFFAHILFWISYNPSSTAFMQERLERLQIKNPTLKLKHQWVPYSKMSVSLKRAVLAGEDTTFVKHHGFDWQGIERAWERNKRSGTIVAGGSTISQQLAKNLFFSGQRTWWRKGQEALVTVMIEAVMSKRRIFEIYLNMIEWGDGVFGAEAGARYHFGVSALALTPEQAARLASMVPSPRRYRPGAESHYLNERTALINARAVMVPVP